MRYMQLLVLKENQKQWEMCFLYNKLTDQLSSKTYFLKVDQDTGDKWLIHGTKHSKDNLEQPGTPL